MTGRPRERLTRAFPRSRRPDDDHLQRAEARDGIIDDDTWPAATPIGLLWWVLGRHRSRIVLGALAGIGWMGAGALLPVVLGAALDGAVDGGSWRSLAVWTLVVAGVVGLQAVASVVRHHVALWLTHRTQWTVEQLVTRRVVDPRGGETGTTGQSVSLASNDTAAIGEVANLMCRGVGAVVTFAVVAVVMIGTSFRLGLLAVVGMPLSLLVLAPLWRPSRDRAAALQQQLAAVTTTTADTITGLRVIKGLGGEPVARNWFADDAAQVERAAVRAARVSHVWPACSAIVPGVILAGIIWIAGPLVLDGTLSPGELVAFTGLAAWLRNPLTTLTEVGQVWTAGIASSRRIGTVLATPYTVDDPAGAMTPDAATVDLEHVADDGGLADLTLSVDAGEHVVIACRDHRAAVALVDLLGRQRAPARGAIRVGGVDIAQIPLEVLRSYLAVEPHHTWLFSGSIADNLALAEAGSPREALVAALNAAAGDDILAGPDGIDRWLGERGAGLSGGQRQRVALARRLVDAPPIVVLHDPTSALDIVTEQLVAERLREIRAERTTIVVTTSPTLLAAADRVIVIDDGHVIDDGQHTDLLANVQDQGRARTKDHVP